MKVTNEQPEETPRLTVADLGVAAWATSELFNYMLEGYEAEEYGAMTKDQMEQSMNTLRTAFVKFDIATTVAEEEETLYFMTSARPSIKSEMSWAAMVDLMP